VDIKENILETVGNTPLVYLRKYGEGLDATIAAKLEMFNPFSIKDRPVSYMIAAAERKGQINPDSTIIEATSGNTGLALAFICAVKGYKLIICMSEIQSEERKRALTALGVQLELTPIIDGTKGAKQRALELLKKIPNSFYIEQHSNPANPVAHTETTAQELWRDTSGEIDILIAGLGTTGTLMGVARALKPRKPTFKIVGVEPEIAPMISAGTFHPHHQAGTSPGFIPKILDRELLDEVMTISEEASFAACRELAAKEGILAGITSGMTAYAARELARRDENAGKLIVCVFADSGERYLSVEGLYS